MPKCWDFCFYVPDMPISTCYKTRGQRCSVRSDAATLRQSQAHGTPLGKMLPYSTRYQDFEIQPFGRKNVQLRSEVIRAQKMVAELRKKATSAKRNGRQSTKPRNSWKTSRTNHLGGDNASAAHTGGDMVVELGRTVVTAPAIAL